MGIVKRYFEDYLFKSPIRAGDSTLATSVRNTWVGVWSESKPHLLNKLDYEPSDVHPNSAFEYTNSFRDDILSCSMKGNV